MITNQAFLFLVFVINGLLIGLIFDFFRIFRKSFKTKDLVTYIQDILFWIISGVIILYSIFVFNNGEIRFFMFVGIVIGIILYISLFSQYVIKISVIFIKNVKKLLHYIFAIIKKPLLFVYKIIRKIVVKPVTLIIINIKKIFKKQNTKINNLIRQKVSKITK